MITSDSVIDRLGGTKAVAEALALAVPTVSVWRVRGIPPGRWQSLTQLASEQGAAEITLEALAELRAREAADIDGARQ